MRQFNKFGGTKGFISMWARMIRFQYMIIETAKQRTRVLAFWEKYGLDATKEAFSISRPTLFRWQKKLTNGGGKLEAFNKKLIEWLLWYNTRRPHWSLGPISPLKHIVNTLTIKESHMLWTDTQFGISIKDLI